MPKYAVHITKWTRYKPEIIEAINEQVAETLVKSAVEGGHVPIESEELDFDVCDITEEDDNA